MRAASSSMLVTMLATAAACSPAVSDIVLLEPDADASGALGTRGPHGARVTRRTLWPADGCSVEADVFTPFDDGESSPCPCVPFLFVQGGSVPLERYRWLGAHLASRGVVAAAATHPLDLAIFAVDHTTRALSGLRAASDEEDDPLWGLVDVAPAIVAGHSLGGVVAAKNWAATEPEEIRHLVLLASFPQEGDALGGRGGRVLSIVGSRDEKSDVGEVAAGAEAFPDADVIVVEGMNHYQWTDDATEAELDTDGTPTESTEVVRRRALTFIDALVDEVRELASYPFDEERSWPAGTRAP